MTGVCMIEVHRKVGWCDDGINNWTLIRSAGSQSIQKVSQVHDVARLNVTETDTSDGAGWRKDVPGSLSTNIYIKLRARLKGGGTNPRCYILVRFTDSSTVDTTWVFLGTNWVIVNLNLPVNRVVWQVEIFIHSDPNQSAYVDMDYLEIIGQDPVDLLMQDPPKWTVEKVRVELLSTVGISRFNMRCNNQQGGLEDEIQIGDHVKIYLADENDAYALWEKVLAGRIQVIKVGRDPAEYLELEGFDYGAYLLDRKWDKEYLTTRELSLILKDALADKVPEISTTGVYATSSSVKNTYKEKDVINLIKELAQMAGFEWWVDPAADIDFYQIGQATVEGGLTPLREQSQTYPVTRLRELAWEERLDDIANRIRLYTFEGEYNPRDQDGWTEQITAWTTTAGTLSADTDRVKGDYSVKVSFSGLGASLTMKRTLTKEDLTGLLKFRFQIKYNWTGSPTNPRVRVDFHTDDNNYWYCYAYLTQLLTWEARIWDMPPGGLWGKTGNPTMEIAHMDFHFETQGGNFGDGAFFLDWIYYSRDPEYVTSQDTGSQGNYGLREKILVDKNVRNNDYAQLLADAYRDQFKKPLRYVTAHVDGSMWWRPAQKCVLDAPSRGISNKTFRIIRVLHVMEPGKDYWCEINFLAARGAGGIFDETVRATLPPDISAALARIQATAETQAIGGAGVIIR